MKLSRVLKKIVSSALVFTFSYTQLLYAADVRQMLLDAKAAFLEEDLRRSMTSEELAASQTTQTSLIDQQNALQSLEGMNFSLTTQNGDILKYVGDKLTQVQRPDGTRLNNIKLDSNGNILNADLRLIDGSIQVFQNGKVLGYKTPDGTDVEYDLTTGEIVSTTKNNLTTTYTKATDGTGDLILTNTLFETRYNSDKTLKQVTDQTTHAVTHYNHGILDKIVSFNGTSFIFQSQTVNNQIQVTFKNALDSYGNPMSDTQLTLPDGSLLKDITWDTLDKAKDATLQSIDGNTYTFINKSLTSIKLPNDSVLEGITWDATGGFLSGKLTDLQNNQFFFTGGQVLSIHLPDGSTLQNITWNLDSTLQNALWTTIGGLKFNIVNGAILSVIMLDNSTLTNITWDAPGNIQNALLTDTFGNTFTFSSSFLTQIKTSQNSLLTNITWDATGLLQAGLLTDLQNNRFSYGSGQVSAVTLASGALLSNITWDVLGNLKNGLLTDLQNNQYTFTNGLISQIKLSDSSVLSNITWGSQGNIQNCLLTDLQGSQYTFVGGIITQIKLSDNSVLSNITWSVSGTVQNCLLTDAQGNQYTFVSGAITQIKLSDGSILSSITWASDNTVSSATLTPIDSSKYTYVTKQLTQSISSTGVITTYAYTLDKITATTLGVKYEYLLDKSLNKITQSTGSYSFFNTTGTYKGLKSQDYTSTGVLSSVYEYQTTGGVITVQKRDVVSTTQAVTSGSKITLSDKNNAYQPLSPLIKTDFKLASTTSTVVFTANQTKTGNITRTLTASYQSGKWTLTRSDLDSTTNKTTTTTTTTSQSLLTTQTYTAELRIEGTKANLYVYPVGTIKPLTPTASMDAFAASTKLQVVLTSATATNYQIQKNLQTPSVTTLGGPALTQSVDTLKNLTLTKKTVSVTKKALSVTKPIISLTLPTITATRKDLTLVTKPSTTPTLTKPIFSISLQTLDVSKPQIHLPENITFESILYNPDGSLFQVTQKDGSMLYFSNGLLTNATDKDGNVIGFDFSQSTLGNLLGSEITQNSVTSNYDEEGRLTSVKLDGMTIHYREGSIDFIEKDDKTKLSNLRFDSQGQVLDAVILTPEGEKRTYREGRLTNILKPDDSVLEFEFDEVSFANQLKKMILNPTLTYDFTYLSPQIIEANLTTPVPDALSIAKMTYDEKFNLKKAIRQNNEIIEYTQDHRIGKITPPSQSEENAQVYEYSPDGAYTVTQGQLKSFYDKDNTLEKVVIDPSVDNPHTLEVFYRYGKIKNIKKDGTLTFEYSYTFDENNQELTHIKDLEEDTLKTYKDELLVKSTDNKTGALSTYLYNEDRTVSQVKVTRLTKTLHIYDYTYEAGKTLVRDKEESITRTYGDALLNTYTLKEEPIKNNTGEVVLDKDGNILAYMFSRVEEPSTKTLNRQLLALEKDGSVFTYTYSQHKAIDRTGKETLSEVMTQEELIKKTFEDGSIADYKDGKLSEMRLKDGSVITDVEVSDDRSLKKAAITLTSGVKKIFDQNTLLEEVLTDGNHLYYDDGRISKLLRPDGKELTYSYEKDPDGNILYVWVKAGTANLKYDLEGNFLGLKLENVLSSDEVQKSTQHIYEGGGTGIFSFDSDFGTAQEHSVEISLGAEQRSVSVDLYSTHIFPSPQTITGLKYRLLTSGSGSGNYSYYNKASGSYSVQYQKGTEEWISFEGTQGGLGDSGEVTKEVSVGGVTAIRAYAGGHGEGSDYGNASAGAAIYEIQFTILDLAYYRFDSDKDEAGNITGYSFRGDGGEVLYDAGGKLMTVTPNVIEDQVLNATLNQAAQSLDTILGSLPKLPFTEKMNDNRNLGGGLSAEYRTGRLWKIYQDNSLSEVVQRKTVSGAERISVTGSNLIREYDLQGNLLGIRLPGINPEPIDGSRSFINHEAVKNSIVSYGNASLSTEGAPIGTGYAVFDGQGDYLALPDSPDWTPQDAFTLDFRIKFDSLEDRLGIAGHYHDTSNLWALDWGDNALMFYQYEAGSKTIDIQNSWTPFRNTWYRITIQKSGNEYKMFVNGVQVGASQTSAAVLKDFNGEFWIGRNPRETDRYLNGAIDEFKFSSDSEIKLLLHFDGIDKSYYQFQKETDTDGKLIGYSLRGDAGNFSYDTLGNLLSSSRMDTFYQFTNQGTIVRLLPSDESGPLSFGDGRDGDVRIAADTVVSRNMYYKSLTINPGVTLYTGNYKIFVSENLVNDGVISADGVGSQGGAGGKGTYPGGRYGAYLYAQSGFDGGSFAGSFGGRGATGISGTEGNQDAGNLGIPGAGGFGGINQSLLFAPLPADLMSDLTSNLYGGAGGGGGGGGGLRYSGTLSNNINGGDGGNGGAGGGTVTIFAKSIQNQNGIISAKGLLGNPGIQNVASWNPDYKGYPGGDGGAGGGGVIYLVYDTLNEGTMKVVAAGSAESGSILNYQALSVTAPILPSLFMDQKKSYDLLDVQNPDKSNWIANTNNSILDAQTIVFQEYSTSGVLETQSKGDGTVTIFDQKNRPAQVLDADGTILIEYTYDANGNPSRVYLKNARDTLPDEVKNSKLQIEENRATVLRQLALQRDSTRQTIKDAYAPSIQVLRGQLSLLGEKNSEVSGMKVQGAAAKKQKGDILSQISSAKDQISTALTKILRDEVNDYAALDSEVGIQAQKIDNDTNQALVSLSNQEKTLKKEILRQEISPIVYDHYRRILGRDPNSKEYDDWVNKIDYDTGKILVGETLSQEERPTGFSASLDGNGDTLSVPDSPDWSFGTGDFTIDLNVKFKSLSGTQVLINQYESNTSYWQIFKQASGNRLKIQFEPGAGLQAEYLMDHDWNLLPDTWYHIAFERQGQTGRLFINGIEEETLEGAVPFSFKDLTDINAPLTLGGRTSYCLNGNLNNVRISKGLARWTSNFTPVLDQGYSPDSYTQFLLKVGYSDAVPFKDLSSYDRPVAGFGDTKLEATGYQTVTTQTPILKEITQALTEHLESLPELQERQAYVNSIKNKVSLKINSYLSMSSQEKEAFASSLQLQAPDLINLSSSDAQKILTWFESRSLHFGQSAFLSLESLLDQKGISYAREDIAEKCILIDILTGVISPLDDGDLVISVFALNKVAKLYGLILLGAKISWDDLKTVYETNPQSQIIAHINGNHFIVIRSIDEMSISYMDPGAGPDKQNDVLTVSRKEFLKVWEGNVTLEEQKTQNVTNIQAKRLSIEETQKIRGAFFPLLFAAVFAVIAQIGAAVFAVLSAIGTIVAGIASFVGALIANIGAAIGGLLHGIGQALYMGIKFAVSSLFKVAGWVGTHMSQAVVGSMAKASFGQALLETVVKVGVNFAVQKGLESIGVNPTIAGFTSAFLTAGTNAFFDPKNAFSWGSFMVEGFKGVALVGSQDLLTRIGVDPQLASILSLVTSPFIDGIQTGNIGGELVSIIPQFAQSLSFFGIQKLADLAGLDPMVSNLIGVPISGAIGAGLEGGANVGNNIVSAINSGILRGATSLGVEYLTQQADLDPLLGSLTSRAITGAIEGALGGNIFEGVFNAFKDSALNVARLGVSGTDSWSQLQYLQRVLNFSDIVRNKGLAQAIEASATQILHEDSISSILQSTQTIAAFIQNALNQNQLETRTTDGRTLKYLKLTNVELGFADDLSDLVEVKQGSKTLNGVFGVDDQGNWGLLTGTITDTDQSTGNYYLEYLRDGFIEQAEIGKIVGGTSSIEYLIQAKQNERSINFAPDNKEILDAILKSPDDSFRVTLTDGYIEQFKFLDFELGFDLATGKITGSLSNDFIDPLLDGLVPDSSLSQWEKVKEAAGTLGGLLKTPIWEPVKSITELGAIIGQDFGALRQEQIEQAVRLFTEAHDGIMPDVEIKYQSFDGLNANLFGGVFKIKASAESALSFDGNQPDYSKAKITFNLVTGKLESAEYAVKNVNGDLTSTTYGGLDLDQINSTKNFTDIFKVVTGISREFEINQYLSSIEEGSTYITLDPATGAIMRNITLSHELSAGLNSSTWKIEVDFDERDLRALGIATAGTLGIVAFMAALGLAGEGGIAISGTAAALAGLVGVMTSLRSDFGDSA